MKKILRKVFWRILSAALVVGLFALLYSTYKKPVRHIGTTERYEIEESDGEDLTDYVSGGYPVFEEDGRTLWVDDGGLVWLTDDASGDIIWRNFADDFSVYVDGTESAALSPLSLQYQFEGEQAVELVAADDVAEGNCQIAYNADETRLQVKYLFGETGVGGILPVGLTAEYMEGVILPALNESDQTYLLRRYELYTRQDASTKVLEACPGIQDQPIYYLADCSQVTKQRKTISILEKAGITEADYQAQCALTGEVQPTMTETYLITIEYWLEDGDLLVNIPCADIRFHPDNPLTLISLNGYATYAESSDEGYYLLPAGTGVLQSFHSDLERNYNYRFLGETKVEKELMPLSGTSFPLPVYGVSREDGTGMLVLIEEGAELAFLKEKFTNQASLLSLSFQILEYGDASITEQNSSTLFGSSVYTGDIRIRHRFMEEGADYNKMASTCQQMLVSQGVLPETVKLDIQCMIEFVGNVQRNIQWMNLYPVTESIPLTTYEQTQQIVQQLEDAGVDHMAVKLSGYNKDGLYSQIPGTYKWSTALGTQQQRQEMLNYLAAREAPIFLDVNLAFYYQQNNNMLSGYRAQSYSAKTLNNAPAVWAIVNESNKKASTRAGSIHVIAPQLYTKLAKETLQSVDSSVNLSLGDSLDSLAVDFNDKRFSDRAITLEALVHSLEILQEERLIAGVNPSMDMLQSVALAENMQTYPDLAVEYTASVPFVQMVLHGHVAYTSAVLNGASDYRQALLEAVETGCIPQYAIVGQFDPAIAETEYDFLYYLDCEKWIETITDDMLRYQKELGDLTDDEIVDHQVQGEIRIVTYDNGAVVYVNYGDETVQIGDVEVPAMSYVRLK